MNAHDIVAKSTELGKLTRSFIASLDTFTENVGDEIKRIDGAIVGANSAGWSGELYDEFKATFDERLQIIRNLANRADALSDKLEECAEKYDVIVDYYRKAGMA